MATKKYNAAEVSVIFGSRAIHGFAADSMVTVERDNDAFTAQEGVDGEVTRSASNSKLGTVTITLMQSSDDNDYFSGIAVSDELTGKGAQALMIRDKNGRTLHTSPAAWIKKQPSNAFNKEAEGREWMIAAAELSMFTGGSKNL